MQISIIAAPTPFLLEKLLAFVTGLNIEARQRQAKLTCWIKQCETVLEQAQPIFRKHLVHHFPKSIRRNISLCCNVELFQH